MDEGLCASLTSFFFPASPELSEAKAVTANPTFTSTGKTSEGQQEIRTVRNRNS